jgi:hypothetical protein
MFLSPANAGAHKGAVVQTYNTYGLAAARAHSAVVLYRSLTAGKYA